MPEESTQVAERTEVLVVGGSLVGLAVSLFLAHHGTQPLLVERRPSTATHPRAWGFNPRTMEVLRSVGLQEAMLAAEEAGIPDVARDGGLVMAETLVAENCRWLHTSLPDLSAISPNQWVFCGQDRVEPLLRRRAEELGSRHCFGTELVGFERAPDGVVATLREVSTGATRTVAARYLVAADGNRSGVRERLGIGAQGQGRLSHRLAINFRADLRPALRGRQIVICYVRNQEVPGGVIMPVDNANGWLLDVPFDPDAGETVDDYTDARCVCLARAAVGDPDLAVEPGERQPWLAGAAVAERFRDGAVLLAGDAAHVMPPTGAMGANTGIQDAHNLAWKLAAVLRGEAGDELLSTYDAERRPIAERTVAQAAARFAARSGPGGPPGAGGPPNGAALVDELTIWFGYRYRSAAVAAENVIAQWADPRHPTGAPGTRAPQLLLDSGGGRIPSLDLYGSAPVLLAGPGGDAWRDAARRAAGRLGAALEVRQLGRDLGDPEGRWSSAHGVGRTGAVLVRPDGVIGWRAQSLPANPERLVEDALRRILCRPSNGHQPQEVTS